jgi:hypothetical protein
LSRFYFLGRQAADDRTELIVLTTTLGPILVLFRDPHRGASFARAMTDTQRTGQNLTLGEVDATSLPAAVGQMIEAGLLRRGSVNVISDDDPLLRDVLINSVVGKENDVRDGA